MEVRIRLQKAGKSAKKRYNYRIVAMSRASGRQSAHLDLLGHYDPAKKPAVISINKEKLARRRLMEHIEASGNYFWKNNQRQKLIDSSRQALIKRIAQTHPGWHQYQPEEQTRVLAEQLEQTPENIHKLLHTNEFEHPDDFTKLVSQLEKIRKSL